jgi:hypothetical protein
MLVSLAFVCYVVAGPLFVVCAVCTCRPLFLKLCEWEAADPAARRVVFFHVIDTIAGESAINR